MPLEHRDVEDQAHRADGGLRTFCRLFGSELRRDPARTAWRAARTVARRSRAAALVQWSRAMNRGCPFRLCAAQGGLPMGRLMMEGRRFMTAGAEASFCSLFMRKSDDEGEECQNENCSRIREQHASANCVPGARVTHSRQRSPLEGRRSWNRCKVRDSANMFRRDLGRRQRSLAVPAGALFKPTITSGQSGRARGVR